MDYAPYSRAKLMRKLGYTDDLSIAYKLASVPLVSRLCLVANNGVPSSYITTQACNIRRLPWIQTSLAFIRRTCRPTGVVKSQFNVSFEVCFQPKYVMKLPAVGLNKNRRYCRKYRPTRFLSSNNITSMLSLYKGRLVYFYECLIALTTFSPCFNELTCFANSLSSNSG